MVAPALNGAQQRAYADALRGVCTKRIRVSLLDRKGDVVEDLSRWFHDGQVIVDSEQDVTRSATVTILDPKRRFGFDADTYQGGDLDLSRQIRVLWQVGGSGLVKPVTVPVHSGPVTRVQRDGPLLTIEAQGKELFGLTPTNRTLTIRKGTKRTDAIKTILRERMGVTRLGQIPDLRAKLPDDLVVGPNDLAWVKAKRLAKSLNRQILFGGDGIVYLRPWPEGVQWRFGADGQGGLTKEPTTTADLQAVKNHIKVTGATPKGKKHPVKGSATADRAHPLSPWQLGPPDAPMWLIEEIHNEHLRTDRECDEFAETRLKQLLRLTRDVVFDASPVPHLEWGDQIRLDTPFEQMTTRLDKFTLPLGLGQSMNVGYVDPYKFKWAKPAPKKKRKK